MLNFTFTFNITIDIINLVSLLQIQNKRPTGLNGHLSIRDFTLTSCQRGSDMKAEIRLQYLCLISYHSISAFSIKLDIPL